MNGLRNLIKRYIGTGVMKREAVVYGRDAGYFAEGITELYSEIDRINSEINSLTENTMTHAKVMSRVSLRF